MNERNKESIRFEFFNTNVHDYNLVMRSVPIFDLRM